MRPMCLMLVAMCTSISFGQIPNGGFENWEVDPDSNNVLVGWETTNSFPIVSVEPYAPGCHGAFAMRVKTVNIGFPFPGLAFLETPYTFTEIPSKISVCLKSTIMPGDIAYIIIGLMKGDSVVALQDSCTFKIDVSYAQYTTLEFPLAIQANVVPDSLVIIVASGLVGGQLGTEIIVDDIEFKTGTTTVGTSESIPGSFSLKQNYPNPFNPTTTITFSVAESGPATMRVYDVLGQEVATLFDETATSGRSYTREFDAGRLASGIYLARLQQGDRLEMRRMLLLK